MTYLFIPSRKSPIYRKHMELLCMWQADEDRFALGDAYFAGILDEHPEHLHEGHDDTP